MQNKYKEFSEWTWKSFSNMRKVLDLDKFIQTNLQRGRHFHVGTDSQVKGKKTTFVTALVAHGRGGDGMAGGEIAIHKCVERPPNYTPYSSLRQRLVVEAMRTLETAWFLDTVLPADAKIRLHLDVSNELQWKSGAYKEELVGMIMGQGYVSYRSEKHEDHPRVVLWKPDSWAAMCVADRLTKK